ncbi:sulfatase [Advenella kashmirensis W13003]|uniref:Sulfatase n=1 Tax=Advenella kashmirensis W13003 TaxID=1424334 RepID=V8QXQ8_9BURK|nr:sulfatase [Advenella kashmirensis]ETF04085.1 sulfatase [Advenella kashmirensis W13003]
MKAVFVLFDSLNRHALSSYGMSEIQTPNFDRLAKRGVTFDSHFVGSLPCLPARRDIQTGRLNFLHRGWGPLEPFDHSLAGMLRDSGIYTHLITDHYHYFEDGGAGFHGRYSSWEFIRGQEKDKWRPAISPPAERYAQRYHEQMHDFSSDINAKLPYFVNREYLEQRGDFPLAQCFDSAQAFLESHHADDQWLLHLECFDPHEPFFAPERFLQAFPDALGGKIFDWPSYGRVDIDAELLKTLRANYHALVLACDHYLGRLLDQFDRLDLWKDTWLIMSTDHGLLLGEKEYLGKNRPPFFNEVAHIPLMIAAPESAGITPRREAAVTQTIDLMPTFLDIFDQPIPSEVTGYSLLPLMRDGNPLRGADSETPGAIYGQFGAAINYTDGRYTYFLYPQVPFEADLYQYTLMPAHMRTFFEAEEFRDAQLIEPLAFTQGFPVLKLPILASSRGNMTRRYPLLEANTALYDLESDPVQRHPINDPDIEQRMRMAIATLLRANDAPDEMFTRYGLSDVAERLEVD